MEGERRRSCEARCPGPSFLSSTQHRCGVNSTDSGRSTYRPFSQSQSQSVGRVRAQICTLHARCRHAGTLAGRTMPARARNKSPVISPLAASEDMLHSTLIWITQKIAHSATITARMGRRLEHSMSDVVNLSGFRDHLSSGSSHRYISYPLASPALL